MDVRLQSPFATVTPTLDGEVLAVLARADDWFTVTQLRHRIGARSPEGIRKTLARLREEGTVLAQPTARGNLYRLNRDHLAAPAIVALAHLREEFQRRLVSEFENWSRPPIYAALFGSASRGEMRVDSDIDVFILRPADVGSQWEDALGRLTQNIHRWTGSDPRLVEFGLDDISGREPLLQTIAEEGLTLIGDRGDFRRMLRTR